MFETNLSNVNLDELCNYNSHCQLYDNKILTGGRRKMTRKRKSKKNRKTRKR
jgi:hypothetical protein